MDVGRIAVRALIAYAYLLVKTRASGKRAVSQATPVDLLVSLILGDLIDDFLWAEVSAAKFAVAVATIVLAELVVKLSVYRWPRLLPIVQGSPVAVMREGREDGHALRGEQLNEGDLEHLLRQHGIPRDQWDEVHIAFVETNHQLSVIHRPEAEPAQKEDAWRVSSGS